MSIERDLAERLEQAVPEAPQAREWADAARRRHRRTRRLQTVGVVAAAACVVGAAVGIPAILDGDGSGSAPVAPADTGTVQPAPEGADGCPPPKQDPAYPADGKVAGGAVGVRLCVVASPGAGRGPAVPADELSVEVGEVVAAVNNAAPLLQDRACTQELGTTYALWFRYADGSRAAVRYEDFSCHALYRAGGSAVEPVAFAGTDVYDTFVRLLGEQRADSTPPGDVGAPPECAAQAAGTALPATAWGGLATIVVCTPTGPHALTADQAAQVSADLKFGEFPNRCGDYSPPDLVGLTVWGDPVRFQGSCGGYTSDGSTFWEPDAGVLEMFRSAQGDSFDPDRAAVAAAFDRFAQGEADTLPTAGSIDLYLSHRKITTLSAEEALDPKAWRICPDEGYYAGHSCPVSAVDFLAGERTRVLVTAPDLPCAHPPEYVDIADVTAVALQPDRDNTCADGGAVTVFFTDQGQIVAVDLTLNEP